MSNKKQKIGYGKPPKQHRFKKGQSGNPGGRPKGTKNLGTYLKQESGALITVREGGREIRIPKLQAVIKRLMEKALQGDTKAIDMLVVLIGRLLPDVEEQQLEMTLSAEELEVLGMLGERFGPDASPADNKPRTGTRKRRRNRKTKGTSP